MIKYTVKIDGMQCGICEAHVNDAVRKAFPVKKVRSFHGKKQTVIFSEHPIDKQALEAAIGSAGYCVLSVTCEPYQKEGLFSSLKK